MSRVRSRFNPPNQHWYEDLPDHQADLGRDIESPTLADDINAISESYLEVSRAGNVIRGGLLMVGIVMVVFFSWLVMHLVAASIGPDDALIFPVISWSLLALGMTCAIFSMVLDCRIPRDMPVRFDRDKGKVYAYDYPIRLMPFPPRRSKLKIFSWQDVQAEITKQSGTTEVLERITLRGNDITTQGLQSIWSYVRRYMEQGPSNLPTLHVRERRISLLNSLFFYMPYLAPGEEGRFYRSRMGAVELILAFLMIWFFWIWLPLGLCYYVAMKCAPQPSWPEGLDRWSRWGKIEISLFGQLRFSRCPFWNLKSPD